MFMLSLVLLEVTHEDVAAVVGDVVCVGGRSSLPVLLPLLLILSVR